MRNKQVEFNPYQNCTVLATKYPFFDTKHPVIILRASLFVVTPSHVASWKMDVKIFLMFIVAENTRSVNIKIYTRPVSFRFPMQTQISVLQSLYLCLSDKKTPKSRKNQCQFFRHVTMQCLSLENICHSFLMLHCRRIPWE